MRLKLIISTLFFLSNMAVMPVTIQADVIDQSSIGFKFQHRRAEAGDKTAQYKLATLYEKGIGTAVDTKQAKRWYEMAADAGLRQAKQRLAYLEVKQQGFIKLVMPIGLNV